MAPLSTADLTDILTQTQSKCNRDLPTRGHMFPGKLAQRHPFGPTLREYGTAGCPVDIQDDWTLEELDAAVAYGAHPSAETPEASAACRQEALEKVQQNLAKLVPWKRLRKLILAGLKRHTKVSPVAAIPHKSHLFRMILDLSTKGQCKSNTQSINELTNEANAPAHSMQQLGNVLGRFIFMFAPSRTTTDPSSSANSTSRTVSGAWSSPKPTRNNFAASSHQTQKNPTTKS